MADGFCPDQVAVRETAQRTDDETGTDPALAARSPSDIPKAGGMIDAVTGDVLLVHTDACMPGALPLVVGRVYRSSWQAGRWFGPSWASALDQRLLVTPERVTAVFADGRILSWRCAAAEDGPLPATGLPVTGPRWRLERDGDAAFTVADPQAGLTWRFERRPGYRRLAGNTGELPLVAVTDRAGHQIGYHYTPDGRPAWITHSGGYRVRVVTSGSRITALALAHGQPGQDADAELTLVRYGYNPAGDLAAVINSADRALCFGYDEKGRLTGWDDRNGTSYRYRYDRHGRCVAGVGPDGVMSATFTYGDRVTWWTDATGAVTTYQLDESSWIAAVTDPLGNVTRYRHDESGRLVARADPLGRLTRCSYDESGHLSAVTRPDGTSWQREYNSRGRLTRQIAPDGAVTSYGYDDRGHLAAVTGPLGAVTRVECDSAGLPVAVGLPGGGTTRFTRDPLGRVTAMIGPNGLAITLAWTVEGLLAGRSFPDGSSEQLDYDGEGNLIALLGPHGRRTSYEYGAFGQVTAMTDQDGSRTEFGYDNALRLISITRAGLTWRYSRDAAGRLVGCIDGIPAELASPGGDPPSPRFPGLGHGRETGLPHYQGRYYDPVTIGHFSLDRLGPLGPELAPNPHARVACPHILADPSGPNAWASAGLAPDLAACISGPGYPPCGEPELPARSRVPAPDNPLDSPPPDGNHRPAYRARSWTNRIPLPGVPGRRVRISGIRRSRPRAPPAAERESH